MPALRKRLQLTAFLLTLLLCAAAAAACVAYLQRGGDTAALADAVLRTAQGEGMPRAQFRGEPRQVDWPGALNAAARVRDWAFEWFSAPVAPDAVDMPAIIEPDLDAAVRVYFAPVQREAPGGMKRALVELIDGAEAAVLVAAYHLGNDGIADALIRRHRAGVRVGVVSDSDYRQQTAMQRVLAAGIPVVFDERSAFMHNKFVVVDGHTVWTGSTNLTDNGFFRNANNAVLVRSSELAANFTVEFNEMFREGRFGPRSPPGAPYPVVNVGPSKVRTLFAPEDDVLGALLDAVHASRTRIEFMAYAFSCEDLAGAMAQGLERGVAVRGLFARIHATREWSRDDYLSARGARVYVDASPGVMHHKVLVFDRELVATGSFNFSRNAARSNDENVLLLRDAAIAARFVEELDRLVLEATEGPI